MATERDDTRDSIGAFSSLAYIVFVLASAIAVYAFVTVAREGETRRRCGAMCIMHPNYVNDDRTAPDFTLTDAKGAKVSLSSYRGKVVVLNFWTKTCGPCMEEMPEISTLTKVLRDRKDVAVLTVSSDDGPEDVRDTLKAVLREDPPFEILFDPDQKVVAGKFGTHLYPETWIIDKRGVIRARFDGAREWSDSAVVEMIDEIRNGGYCPVEIKDSRPQGEAAKTCKEMGNMLGGS